MVADAGPSSCWPSWCSSTASARCTTTARTAACCSGSRCRSPTATRCCRRCSAPLLDRTADRRRRRRSLTMFGFAAAATAWSCCCTAAIRSRCCGRRRARSKVAAHLLAVDPGVRAVGAADRGLADAVLGLGQEQAVPVGGDDPGVRRHLRELVRPDARLRPGHGWFWKNIVARALLSVVPGAAGSTRPTSARQRRRSAGDPLAVNLQHACTRSWPRRSCGSARSPASR